MDQDTKNQLERHDNLKTFFQDTKPRWEGVPALKKRVDGYLSRQGALPAPPPDADRDNPITTGAQRGATLDKGTARQTLATLLPPVAASLHLWLLEKDNLPADELAAGKQRALAAQLNIRQHSRLVRMGAGGLIGLAQVAIDALDRVPPADLAEYDLTTTDTADFEAAAALFGIRRGQPKAAQNAASTAAEKLDRDLDDLDDYVLGELKTAVNTRRVKDPDFVSGFKKAYRLTDRRGARKGKKGGDGGSAPAPQL